MTKLYKLINSATGFAIIGDLTGEPIYTTDPNSAIAQEIANNSKTPAKWVEAGHLI